MSRPSVGLLLLWRRLTMKRPAFDYDLARCIKHPDYTVDQKPDPACDVCVEKWTAKQQGRLVRGTPAKAAT